MATPAPPMVSPLNVAYLYVCDMTRAMQFCGGLLGLPLEVEDGWAEAVLPGGVRFALHATHEGVGELSSGTVHIDFEVDDADVAAERLRAAGIEVRETMRDGWGAAVEVIDPDGYKVYLYEPAG